MKVAIDTKREERRWCEPQQRCCTMHRCLAKSEPQPDLLTPEGMLSSFIDSGEKHLDDKVYNHTDRKACSRNSGLVPALSVASSAAAAACCCCRCDQLSPVAQSEVANSRQALRMSSMKGGSIHVCRLRCRSLSQRCDFTSCVAAVVVVLAVVLDVIYGFDCIITSWLDGTVAANEGHTMKMQWFAQFKAKVREVVGATAFSKFDACFENVKKVPGTPNWRTQEVACWVIRFFKSFEKEFYYKDSVGILLCRITIVASSVFSPSLLLWCDCAEEAWLMLRSDEERDVRKTKHVGDLAGCIERCDIDGVFRFFAKIVTIGMP